MFKFLTFGVEHSSRVEMHSHNILVSLCHFIDSAQKLKLMCIHL
jgi:hypothetical protein